MKRAWKFAAAAAGAVVLALIAVAAVAPLLVGDARYRAWVGEAVESRIGRELTISGDIEVRLLPRPRVVIADLALARARGYGEGRFAEIERLSADLALLPLLAGRVVVARLHVDGLRVELERDAAGRTNWADLLAARPAPGAGDTLGLPALGGLELDDATLVWRDRAAGEHLVLSVLHLHTGSLTAGGAVEVTANFRVADRVRGLRGVSRLAAELLPGADLAAIDVPRIELDGALVGATPAGRAIELAVRGDLRLDRRAALLTSSGIDVTASGPLDATFHAGIEANLRGARVLLTGVAAQARLAPGGSTRIDLTVRTDRPLAIDVAAASLDGGTLRVDARASGAAGLDVALAASGALAGDLARRQYAWTDVTGSGEATRVDGDARPIALAIGGDVTLDARDATLAVGDLHLAVAGARASGGIEAAWPGGEPLIGGRLVSDPIDVRSLLADLGIADRLPADSAWPGTARASMQLAYDGERLTLAPLTLELDEARIEGELGVTPGDTPSVNFDLRATRLADAWLVHGTPEITARGAAVLDPAAGTLVSDDLRFTVAGADVRATVTIGSLRAAPRLAGRVQAAEFDPRPLFAALRGRAIETADPSALARAAFAAKVSAGAGSLELGNLRAQLDESELTGTASVTLTHAPRVRFDLALDRIDLDRYLPPGGAATRGAGEAGTLPIAAIVDAHIAGELRIGTLVIEETILHDVVLRAHSDDDVAQRTRSMQAIHGG